MEKCDCGRDDCDYCGPASLDEQPLFVDEEAQLLVELHSAEHRRRCQEDNW